MGPSTLAGLGVSAAVFLGMANLFAALAARRLGAVRSGLAITLVATVAYGLVWVVHHDPPPQDLVAGVALAAVSAVLVGCGTLFLLSGLATGPVTLVSPVSATYPLVTTLVEVVVFGASLSAAQVGAIVVVTAGICAVGGLFTRAGVRGTGTLGGVLLALFAALSWGVGYPLVAQATKLLGWQLATVVEFAVMSVLLAATVLAVPQAATATSRRARLPAIGAGLLQALGIAAMNAGLASGAGPTSSTIVIVLSSCSPIITMLFAVIGLHERPTLPQSLGTVLVLGGAIVLGLQ